MKKETRRKFDAYVARIAEVNDVESATVKFNVEPSVQQKLEDKIQEDNGFLKLINIVPVTEMKGDKLGLAVGSPIASRTKTTGGAKREPREVGVLDQQGYECVQTDFDTAFSYARLDMWAKFEDFQQRLQNQIVTQQGLDRLIIGWNGTSRADTTDRDTSPLLQDVNKGWLQIIREQSAKTYMKEVVPGSKAIRVGPGGDYENLDALAEDMKMLLAPWYQGSGDLRVIVNRNLMHEKYFPIINRTQGAQDELASQVLVSQKSIGGHPGLAVPFFPANTILLTAPSNLSIYVQEGARRRFIREEPDANRVANYESSNEDYVVEDLEYAALAENIVFGDWSGAANAGAGN